MLSRIASTLAIAQHRRHFLQLISRTCLSDLIGDHHSVPWTIVASELSSAVQFSDTSLSKPAHLFRSGSNPSAFALVHLIRACANAALFSGGRQLHALVLKSGCTANVFVSTALVDFYAKNGRLTAAHHLFDEMPEPTLVSWNTLISGYVHSGRFGKALKLFICLDRSGLYPDSYSFTAALSACGQPRLGQVGKSLHSRIVKNGVECSLYVSNCLIDMYGKCGYVSDARMVFGGIVDKDMISWNSVLAANARNGELVEAFTVFNLMPNRDTITYNELIDGIARFGDVDAAITLLSQMPSPNSSSWNSIITGYVNRSHGRGAVEVFGRMRASGICPDEFTFSSLLSGIAGLSDIALGSLTHCCAMKCGLDQYAVVGSAIINMYFKCGNVEEAERMFQWLPDKNLVTWNAMISGYGHSGDSPKVIDLFNRLRETESLHPDEITFLNVISACWHCGLPLKVANKYFQMMMSEYRIDPTPEHCSLMVRIMGQDGDLSKSVRMIYELGYGGCGMVWKALLGACGTSGSIELAKLASKKVMELEGDGEYVYVMLSNIYATHGKWEEVRGVRRAMMERKVWKEPGRSWMRVS